MAQGSSSDATRRRNKASEQGAKEKKSEAALISSPSVSRPPSSQGSATPEPALPSPSQAPSKRDLLLSTLPPWILVLTLIFGGCCSNAYYLELSTRRLPACGTLLTFLQFFITTLQTLPSQMVMAHFKLSILGDRVSIPIPMLRKTKVPLARWAVQVALYYATSLLNNSAFAYHVPMPVHIIFRSGGLVVNMLVGWAIKNRRYSPLQILSVLLVTFGVILSTLATTPQSSSSTSAADSASYFKGISLLTLALFISSLMGLWQETTFAKYGSEHWREALFYSHALSLPLFVLSAGQLKSELAGAQATPLMWLGWGQPPTSSTTQGVLTAVRGIKAIAPGGVWDLRAGLSVVLAHVGFPSLLSAKSSSGAIVPGFFLPSLYPPLFLNVVTQLLCINGVNRLTAQVSSLTVTLVLVVRKAVSLGISLLLVGGARGAKTGQLTVGAAAVLVGTVGYTLGSSMANKAKQDKKEKEKEKEKKN